MGLRRRSVRRNVGEFTHGVVRMVCSRFMNRANQVQGVFRERKEPSWSYCVIRNKAKMAARLAAVIQENERLDAWGVVIVGQQRKVARLVDLYTRWAKREAHLLDEMNRGDFRQEFIRVFGSRWAYAATLQKRKLEITIVPGLPDDSRRLPGWEGVQNRAKCRLMRLVHEPAVVRDSWEFVIGGTAGKVHRLGMDGDWSECLMRWRRRVS